jgi:hypothetical protein
MTRPCEECGAPIVTTLPTVNGQHASHCSLYPANVVEARETSSPPGAPITETPERLAFDRRISRADAIAIINRGGDYVVHAASNRKTADGSQETLCGRWLRPVVNEHPRETLVSCANCQRNR